MWSIDGPFGERPCRNSGHRQENTRVTGAPAPGLVLCARHWDSLYHWGWREGVRAKIGVDPEAIQQRLDAERTRADILWTEIHAIKDARVQMYANVVQSVSLIYVLRRHADDAIKIGTTVDIRTRLRQHAAVHGKLDVLAVFPGSYDEEAALHRRFAADLIEGKEWFRLSSDVQAWIQLQT